MFKTRAKTSDKTLDKIPYRSVAHIVSITYFIKEIGNRHVYMQTFKGVWENSMVCTGKKVKRK